jgi:Na+-driven multidrug efflux pump
VVIAHGADCLRFVSYGYGYFGFAMAFVQAFNGAGDTTTPTIMTFFTHWIFQLPVAYLLATRTVLGVTGVFVSSLLTQTLVTIISYVLFRRGSWQRQRI